MKIKLEHLYTLFATLALCTFFINIVAKASLLLELIVLTNFVVYIFQGEKFRNINGNTMAVPLWAALSFLLICIAIFIETKVDSEAYRLFFIPIAYLSFSAIRLNYPKLLRALFWLSVAGAAYNIFDVVYFNLVLVGDISRHFASSGLSSLEDTQYDQLVTFFGLFPFFRPFGIFGQPQKSAFIAAIGILCYYYLTRLDGTSMRRGRAYWISLYFFIAALVTGGTTGILATLMVFAIIYAGEFGVVVSSFLAFGTIASLVVAVYFVVEHPLYYNAFAHDVSGLFGGDIFRLAFGNGFLSAEDLFKEGFGHEHFIFRVIYEIGLLPFICWTTLLVFSIFRQGFRRAGALLVTLMLMMVAHYSITNVYFVVIFLCISMCALTRIAKV
jgi:hypothetical protein